jgi:voltage-gated potassium channel
MFVLLSRLIKGAGRRRRAAVLLAGVAAVVIVGGGLFAWSQHLPFTTGLYWAITTATTVGYGDVTPKNPTGRLVASAVMLTSIPMLAAAFALLTGQAVARGIRKVLDMDRFPEGSYRIVVGFHPSVPAILEELARADDAVVLVADIDPLEVRSDVHVVKGDPTDPATLRRARPQGALHALVTGANEGDVLVSTVMLRRAAPDLPVSAVVDSQPVREALEALGVSEVVAVNDLVAHTMAKSLEAPHAGALLLGLINSERHVLVEVEPEGAAVGRTLSQIRSEREGLVLGLVSTSGVDLGIGSDPTVSAGDTLLVVVPRS